jgi:hypothetical protein
MGRALPMTHVSDEQIAVAHALLREHAEHDPREPVNIHTVLEGLDIEDHPGRRAGDRSDLPGCGPTTASTAPTATGWSSYGSVSRAELVERILGMADGYRFGQ